MDRRMIKRLKVLNIKIQRLEDGGCEWIKEFRTYKIGMKYVD